MRSQAEQERLDRVCKKHAEGLLLWELGDGFELSPRESHLVLETAKAVLLEHRVLDRGRVWTVGVEVGRQWDRGCMR